MRLKRSASVLSRSFFCLRLHGQRVNNQVKVAVDDGVDVEILVVPRQAVVGDAVLWEVVGAGCARCASGADSRRGARSSRRSHTLTPIRRACSQASGGYTSRVVLHLRTLPPDTPTIPVGLWISRTAELVLLTCCHRARGAIDLHLVSLRPEVDVDLPPSPAAPRPWREVADAPAALRLGITLHAVDTAFKLQSLTTHPRRFRIKSASFIPPSSVSL